MHAFRQQDRHTYSNSHLASVCDVTHLPDTLTECKGSQYSHFGYKKGRIDCETCMYVCWSSVPQPKIGQYKKTVNLKKIKLRCPTF
jgi:hypothetical protein